MVAQTAGMKAALGTARRSGSRPTSEILQTLADEAGDKIAFGDVTAATGSRKHGFGLVLFALPELLPIPFVGFSAILAIPLGLLSLHLLIYGERTSVPEGVRRREMPSKVVKAVAKYAVPVFRRIEAVSRPRLAGVAEMHWLIGLVCLVLSGVLALPIPLGNFLPALCLVVIAFGMVQRDGLIVLVGMIGAVGVSGGLYFAAGALRNLVT